MNEIDKKIVEGICNKFKTRQQAEQALTEIKQVMRRHQ